MEEVVEEHASLIHQQQRVARQEYHHTSRLDDTFLELGHTR